MIIIAGVFVVKIRTAGRNEDYIEIEVTDDHMTYEGLKSKCCLELGVEYNNVERMRKMPDVKLRSDADISRFNRFESIEIVLKQNTNGFANNSI